MDVYLLPGLGTDHRLFERFRLEAGRTHILAWPEFKRGITLPELATALGSQVDRTRPHVLVGVSMGGMVAQEMAPLTGPDRVVLISSWTGPHEWPLHIRAAASLGLHHLITDPLMRLTWPLKQRVLGQRNKELDQLLFDMACAESAPKIRRGAGAILRWKGASWNGPVTRIHGDNDRIIPLRFPVDHVVKGGGHVMIIDRAKEVSTLVNQVIGKERV